MTKTRILVAALLIAACSRDPEALRKRIEILEGQVGRQEGRIAQIEARQERRQASLAATVPRMPDFMGDAAPHAAQDTEEQRARLRQLFDAMARAAGDEETAMRAWNALLRTFHFKAQDISRTLTFDILDQKGHVKDPLDVAQKMRARVIRMYGEHRGLMALRNFCGAECGSVLFHSALN